MIEKESSFRYTEIEHFWDSNDEVRPLLSKWVILTQNRHEP